MLAVVSLISTLVAWIVGGLFGCLASLLFPLFGCIVFPIFVLGNIVAVVTGHLAQSQIGNSGGTQSGGAMATTGVILGWIGNGLTIVVVIIIPALHGGGSCM